MKLGRPASGNGMRTFCGRNRKKRRDDERKSIAALARGESRPGAWANPQPHAEVAGQGHQGKRRGGHVLAVHGRYGDLQYRSQGSDQGMHERWAERFDQVPVVQLETVQMRAGWEKELSAYRQDGRDGADDGRMFLPVIDPKDKEDEEINEAYKEGFEERRKELGESFRWEWQG